LEVEKYEKGQFKRIASNLQQSLETEKHQRKKMIHILEAKFEIEKQAKLKLEQSYKIVSGELIPENNKELERLEDTLKLTLKKVEEKKQELKVKQIYDDQKSCNLCMDKQKNIALMPCGHVCVCNECSESLIKCPVCRSTIHQKVKVFI